MTDIPTSTLSALFLSSLAAFGTHPSILVDSLITLPILLHLFRPEQNRLTGLLAYAAVVLGSTIAYLPTTWGMLPLVQTVALQLVFSLTSSAFIVAPLLGHRLLVDKLRVKDSQNLITSERQGGGEKKSRSRWLESAGFPVFWMSSWLLFEQTNPFGRQGSPTGTTATLPTFLHPTLRHLGQPGIDFLSASYAILISRIFAVVSDNPSIITQIFNRQRQQRETESNQRRRGSKARSNKSTDLIGFEDESRAEGSLDRSSLENSRGDLFAGENTTTAPSSRRSSGMYGTFGALVGRKLLRAVEPAFGDLFDNPYRAFVGVTIGMTILPIFFLGIGSPLSLSAPVSQVTPISVGCVLPLDQPHHLETMLKETEQLAPHAKVLLWPEQALHLRTNEERAYVFDEVERIAARHGIWVGVALGSPARSSPTQDDDLERDKRRNELVLIGPHGVVGEYEKKDLVPFVESYGHMPGAEEPPLWTIDLPPPRGVKRPDWTERAPYTRPVEVMPLICLDALHPSVANAPVKRLGTISTRKDKPSLILLSTSPPKTARGGSIAALLLDHAKSLAIQHDAQVLVCDGSGKEAVAGLIDTDGTVRYRQRGEGGFTLKTGIPYGRRPHRTGWEILGALGVWGGLVGLVTIGAAVEYVASATRSRDRGEDRGEGWNLQDGLQRFKRALGMRPRDEETDRLIDAS